MNNIGFSIGESENTSKPCVFNLGGDVAKHPFYVVVAIANV
ncbi:hypothetical protein [Nostoc sp. NMS4]|nr:hypothetical protein [Nostoc sp. NMS4]